MANSKHVAVVRKGAGVIAEWVSKHSRDNLDLSGADLRTVYFSWANLRGANLSGADLTLTRLMRAYLHRANLSAARLSGACFEGADLSGAQLCSADLRGAILVEANLSEADLGGADLSEALLKGAVLNEADLSEANLKGADLSETHLGGANLAMADLSRAYLFGASLSRANLSGTRLAGAYFGQTSLSDVDLSGADGLASVQHSSPSSVGMDTLVASFRGAGNRLTPELRTFLRGAGVAKELLDALPGIVAEVKYHSCFISYGQPDTEFAKKLYEDLRAGGVTCYLYGQDMKVGERTWPDIDKQLDAYQRMVVLCSIDALLRDGVKKEIDKQIDKNPDRLVPASLDNRWTHTNFEAKWAGRDLKAWLMDRNYADFANKPYQEALEELLRGLRRPEVKKARRSKKPS